MVSFVWAAIALSLGVLIYLIPPVLAPMLPVESQQRVGAFYYRMAARSLDKFAFVYRMIGGWDIIKVDVDDERKLAQVTLSSGIISDDKKLPFKDPDNRISRLYNKSMAVVVEDVPAAIDAELSELGHWTHKHDVEHGLFDGQRVNPYMRVRDGLRAVNPLDSLYLVGSGVEPENVETAKQLTKKRFSEYGSNVGVAETLGTITGFIGGVLGVAGLQYLNQGILDSSGGGTSEPTSPVPVGVIEPAIQPVLDAVVVLV
jgi:hypothetical protein